MSVIISRQKLASSLSKIVAIVEKRSTMPILRHVKIDIDGSTVHLTTTDMDTIARTSFSTDHSENYQISFTTVAQTLHDISRKMFCQDMSFILDQNNRSLTIKSNSNQFVLPCLEAATFPNFDQIQPEFSFDISVGSFYFLLQHVKHAMSQGDSRYYLNGLYLHSDGAELVAVATDIHRMAVARVPRPIDMGGEVSVILPRKVVIEMHRILEDYEKEEKLRISVSNQKISFFLPDLELTSKLIDARFPNYKAALPANVPMSSTVDVLELTKAVDLVTTISEAKVKSVRILFAQDRVSLSVDNQVGHKSSGVQDIEAQTNDYQGSVVEVIINARYLLDVLSVIDSPRVSMLVTSGVSPILVRDDSTDQVVYVLMPMQFGS